MVLGWQVSYKVFQPVKCNTLVRESNCGPHAGERLTRCGHQSSYCGDTMSWDMIIYVGIVHAGCMLVAAAVCTLQETFCCDSSRDLLDSQNSCTIPAKIRALFGPLVLSVCSICGGTPSRNSYLEEFKPWLELYPTALTHVLQTGGYKQGINPH